MGRYDTLDEVRKHASEAKTFEEVLKFNPYHDARGRFSSSNGATSFTIMTSSAAGQKAIANIRAKELAAAGGATSKPAVPTQKDHPELGDKTRTEYIRDSLGVSDTEAQQMATAIGKFTGITYSDIRKFQTDGPPPNMAKYAKPLEDFIEKSPKWDGGEVYRGIRVDNKVANKIIENAQAGKTIGQMGASSWSTDRSISEDHFAYINSSAVQTGKRTAIIFKSSGTQNGTSIKHISAIPSENEVLMSNKARWKPKKVTQLDNYVWEIECEPIN